MMVLDFLLSVVMVGTRRSWTDCFTAIVALFTVGLRACQEDV